MIPRHLRISGFLSYRDAVELDFTTFELACISGHNGAGKSSLLDAITWALFGEARGRQEAIINLQSQVAEVIFTFDLEGNTYRVLRSLQRGKSVVLEFQVQDAGNPTPRWRPLTERSVRETQARLESILRMDYETFINTSFFLQGKADQFAQQTPAKRKEVLASVLGLEVWESYRERAATRRRSLEDQVAQLEGALREIEQELSEEAARRQALQAAEAELKRWTQLRQQQEQLCWRLRENYRLLEIQQRRLDEMKQALAQLEAELNTHNARRWEYEQRLVALQDTLARADEIQARYRRRQELRAELDRIESLRLQFGELEAQRQAQAQQVETERVRLEAELRHLQEQEAQLKQEEAQIAPFEAELQLLNEAIVDLETQLSRLQEAQTHKQQLLEEQAQLTSEKRELKRQMEELKARIDRLQEADARCPLCGQALTAEHRQRTIDEITAEGKALGQRYRQNLERLQRIATELSLLAEDHPEETLRRKLQEHTARRAAMEERRRAFADRQTQWQQNGLPRREEIERLLQTGEFALEARRELLHLEEAMRALGYDPAYHQACLQEFQGLQAVEEDYRLLETARLEMKTLEERIGELTGEARALEEKMEHQRHAIAELEEELRPLESLAGDLNQAEEALLRFQEEENRALAEVGARRQLVEVLETQRQRARTLREEKEKLQVQIADYRTLERAFGKDGVPALLIEQALPQIEARANEILDRLSNGQLSLRFVTQTEYKDKKRADRRETLEIQIGDSNGIRPYEMYSGGEAFRVNFALRLALAQVLAQRRGARLQTLIIDEGFGSQDDQGRQRLIEAINLVRPEFAKILVITHLDELKDAFPVRIEVEKGARGSTLRVI